MLCSLLSPHLNFTRKVTVCLHSFIPICADRVTVGMVIIMKDKGEYFWKRWKEIVVFVVIICVFLILLSSLLTFIKLRILRAVFLWIYVILVGVYNWYRIMIGLLKVNPALYNEYLKRGWRLDKSSMQLLLDVQTRYEDIPFLKTVYARMRFYQIFSLGLFILIPIILIL